MSITHRDDLRNLLCLDVISLVDIGTVYGTGRLVIFDQLNNAIATCPMAKPAFQAAVAGLSMANPIGQDNSPSSGATPVRFEVQDCNGQWVFRGTCGTNGDLQDIGTPIPAGLPVKVDNFFYRAPF